MAHGGGGVAAPRGAVAARWRRGGGGGGGTAGGVAWRNGGVGRLDYRSRILGSILASPQNPPAFLASLFSYADDRPRGATLLMAGTVWQTM